MKTHKYAFWIAFVISAVLFFTPMSVGGRDGFGMDKIVHAGTFFALTVLSLKAFPSKKPFAVVLLLGYMFATEFIQGRYLPLRHFDWWDITFDSIGLILGILVYLILNLLFVENEQQA